MFGAEKTLSFLRKAGFKDSFAELPLVQRVTHPANHGFPDATFDYFFGKNVQMGKPMITQTNVSDHLPVTCDVTIH